jgi:hypothetical protein
MKPEIKFFALLSVLAVLSGCTRSFRLDNLSLPASSVISTEDRFALIIDPYVSLRDQPGDSGITIAHGRRGEIFVVAGNRLVESGKSRILWINLGSGWVAGASVQLCSSREKAETISATLK